MSGVEESKKMNSDKCPRWVGELWVGPRGWRWIGREVAAVTAAAFFFSQVAVPAAFADQPKLPDWLKKENGGWLSDQQAEGLSHADQQLLDHLAALNAALQDPTQGVQRVTTGSSSGVEAQYIGQELIAARDAGGNVVFTPTLEQSTGKVLDGFFLLADGTLQDIENGRVLSEFTLDGRETAFRADSRVDFEVSPEGIRSDYAYTFDARGNPTKVVRTTHLSAGNLVEEYDGAGTLTKRTEADGSAAVYAGGFLSSVTAHGFIYTYKTVKKADGTATVSLLTVKDAANKSYTFTLTNGRVTRLKAPDGSLLTGEQWDSDGNLAGGTVTLANKTVETVKANQITTVIAPDKTEWDYDAGYLRKVVSGGVPTTYSYTFDAQGRIATVTVTWPDGSSRTYTATGAAISFSDKTVVKTGTANQAATKGVKTPNLPATIVNRFKQPVSPLVGLAAGMAKDLPALSFNYLAPVTGSTSPVGFLKEAARADGTLIRAQNGIPWQMVASDGTVTNLSVQQQGKLIDSFGVSRSGVTATYSMAGDLETLTLPDDVELFLEQNAILELKLPDGTVIEDGVYDDASHLVSGKVTLPDGRTVVYADSRPTEAHLLDGTAVAYTDGQPSALVLSTGLNYQLGKSDTGRWIASLQGTAPAQDALTRMVYSSDWVLEEATRADGAQLLYHDGRLLLLTQSNGTVISYAYDDAGKLANTVAVSADPAEPSIRNEYAYDRIRKVYRAGDLIFDYTYEFDSAGQEITVLNELQTGFVKRYRDGLLISQTDPDGAVTSYTYTQNRSGFQDPWQNATGAVETLAGGTKINYQRAAGGGWIPVEMILSDGLRIALSGDQITAVTLADGRSYLPSVIPGSNLLPFASFQDWSNGTSAAPDGWWYDKTLPSVQVSKGSELTPLGDTTAVIHPANSVVEFRLGSNTLPFSADGKQLTFGAWIKASQADQVRLYLMGGNQPVQVTSRYHSGSGDWEFLWVTRNYWGGDPAASIEVQVGAGADVEVGGMVVFEGTQPIPWTEKLTSGLISEESFEDWSDEYQRAFHQVGSSQGYGWFNYWVSMTSQAQVDRDQAQVKEGRVGVKMYAVVSGTTPRMILDRGLNAQELDSARGKRLSFGGWIKTSNPQAVQVALDLGDGTPTIVSPTANGEWGWFHVETDIPANAQSVTAWIKGDPDNPIYVDGLVIKQVQQGESAQPLGIGLTAEDLLTFQNKMRSLLQNIPQLPTDRATLQRMVDQGALALTVPPPTAQPPAALAAAPVLAQAAVTYQGKEREKFSYRYEDGKTFVTDQTGTTRVYDGTNRLVGIEQPDGTQYAVSYAQDLSEAQAAQLQGLPAGSAEAEQILQHPDGARVMVQRLTRLVLPDGTVQTKDFAADAVIEQEFDSGGQLLSRTQANGQVTLYDSGQPSKILDAGGHLSTEFQYDSTGRLVKITLAAARQEVADQIAQARAEVERRKSESLEELANRKGLATTQITDQVVASRRQLEGQRSDLQQTLNDLEGTDVHGNKAKRQKSQAMDQIRAGLNQIRDAVSDLDRQYAQALGSLESQVESTRRQLDADSAQAFAAINQKEVDFTKSILLQEIQPIVMTIYRSTIGRDPSGSELSEEVDRLYSRYGSDPGAVVDAGDVAQRVRDLADYAPRLQEVAAIKQQVSDWLRRYVTLQGSEATQAISSLGLSPSEVVPLSAADVDRILTWLTSRSAHFGHSAFLALKEYLAAQGKSMDGNALATQAILIDILSGVITPKTTGDLEISLFSLSRVAQQQGASAIPAQVSFDELRTLAGAAPTIAHVNGNHYILITSIAADGTVTYREPNAGPTGQALTMTQAEFAKIWKGTILSARAPPKSWEVLTTHESQRVTGSFFPLIFVAIAAIASSIGTAIGAVVGAVATLLTALGSILASVFSALGTAFSSIGSLFGGFGSLFSGAGLIGQGFSALFAGQILGGLGLIGQGILTAVGLSSFSLAGLGQFALSTAVNIGFSKGLESLGVDPAVAGLVSSFAGGFTAGGLSPVQGTTWLSSAITSSFTSLAISGTQLGLVKAGLDPSLASLGGIGVGAISNQLLTKGLSGLGNMFSTKLAPQLSGELAFYGVQKLGAVAGLDPRISQLAGMPIKAGIGNIAKTGNLSQGTLDAMWQGLKEGATSIGLQFATKDLDPLLGGFTSAAVTSAIDGLVSPNFERDPVTGRPKPIDKNGDGVIDFRDSKGIFAGISETYSRAVGGFTEIGLVVPGNPVATAQGLAKLNDFSQIIREQGLGTALETYATSIFYRNSIESLLNAGSSVGQYGTVKQSIEAQLKTPLIVELEGKNAIQISLGKDPKGNPQYIWLDPTTYVPVGSLQGQDYIRYGQILVDPTTRTLGTPNATIERTFTGPDGATVTARFLEEISAGGVTSVKIQSSDGIVTYTVAPSDFQDVRLNADGSIQNGILRDQQSGRKFYFQNGEVVNTVTPASVTIDTPQGAKELQAQVQVNAQGQTEVKIDRTEMADGIVRATMGKSLQQLEEEARTSPGAAGQLKNFWERIRNAVTWQGFKTDEQLALEKARAIDAIVKVGQTGDFLMLGSPGLLSVAIRTATFAPVNHTAYLQRDSDGRLWVIDVNPRGLNPLNKQDMLRTPFEEWVKPYTVVVAGRQNDPEAGKAAIDFLLNPRGPYGYDPATNTFKTGPRYNYLGALFGGIPLLGDLTRDNPNRKFCAELVCDTQEAIKKPLPGLSQNSWRTPGDLLRALPKWGKNLLDLVPPAQAEGNGNS